MKIIKFLGTAGARLVMIKQLRASGGIWLQWEGTNILIDPGPGTLVRCARSRPRLDPTKLEGIILTHRHLDHSGDINVMIEAMSEGGFKKRGTVFAPGDALNEDPIILKYLRQFVDKWEILREGGEYSLNEVVFNTPVRHRHGVETYGLNFKEKDKTLLSLIIDTHYFEGLEDHYPGKILILNVVRYQPRADLDHLSVPDVERIIASLKPRAAILTHFGMTMLRANPRKIAAQLEEKLKVRIFAAYDGMRFNLDEFLR